MSENRDETARARYRIATAGALLIHAAAAALVFAVAGKSLEPSLTIGIPSIEIVGDAPAEGARARTGATAETQPATHRPSRATPRAQVASMVASPAARVSGAGGSPSASTGPPSAIGSYLAQVRDRLSREIHPPRAPGFFGARPLRVTLEMTLASDGAVKNSSIRESSGSSDFDRSVTEALRRASPFPPFTAAMGGMHELTLQLPVEIRFRD